MVVQSIYTIVNPFFTREVLEKIYIIKIYYTEKTPYILY